MHIRIKKKEKSGGKIGVFESLVKPSTVFSITQKGDTHFEMSVPVYQLCLSTFQLTSLKNGMSSSVWLVINYDLDPFIDRCHFSFSSLSLEFLFLKSIFTFFHVFTVHDRVILRFILRRGFWTIYSIV